MSEAAGGGARALHARPAVVTWPMSLWTPAQITPAVPHACLHLQEARQLPLAAAELGSPCAPDQPQGVGRPQARVRQAVLPRAQHAPVPCPGSGPPQVCFSRGGGALLRQGKQQGWSFTSRGACAPLCGFLRTQLGVQGASGWGPAQLASMILLCSPPQTCSFSRGWPRPCSFCRSSSSCVRSTAGGPGRARSTPKPARPPAPVLAPESALPSARVCPGGTAA